MHSIYFPFQTQLLGSRQLATSAAFVALTLFSNGAQAADLTEADMVRQLSSHSDGVEANDPNAAFANDTLQSKKLERVRKPDTNGACLANSTAQLNTKTLVVIALAPPGAPQVTLALQFANASYTLSNTDTQQLNRFAHAMQGDELRSARFTVAGHTDAFGDVQFNEKLSCARALSVRTYLIEQGVASERLSAYGFGSSRPVVAGAIRSAENRRVEVRRAED